MEKLQQICLDYVLGAPQQHKNMKVVPIQLKKGSQKSVLDYILLAEGIKSGQVDIREVERGTVNTLWLSNNSDKDLFVMRGEYVVGGKQNRMITINGLVAAYTGRTYIPVHCIERHRWDAPKEFGLGDKVVSAGIRSSVSKGTSKGSGQSSTWDNVDRMLSATKVNSSTHNFADAYGAMQGTLTEYLNAFHAADGQIGAIAIVAYKDGETQFFIDMFDQERTLQGHYERLVASYAMDAAVQNIATEPKSVEQDAEKFLQNILLLPTKESASISLGEDHEIRGNGVQGEALVYQNTIVYLGAKSTINREKEQAAQPQASARYVPIATRRGFL